MTQPQVPVVTVVIAAWNAEDSITRAVESALAQEGPSIEVIVVDDASRDGTRAAVERIRDERVRCLSMERNGGPGAARNRGFMAARGRWIAVLDADDWMAPDRLGSMIGLGEGEGAHAVIDDLTVVSEDGAPLGPFFGRYLEGTEWIDLSHFILANRIFSRAPNLGYAKPVFRAAFLRDRGLAYDPDLRIGEDYGLLADCLAAGACLRVQPRAGYFYTRRRGSTSHRIGRDEIAAIRAADAAFAQRWPLDERARAAMARRDAALADAAAFADAVEAIKQNDWTALAGAIGQRPGAALLFRYPLKARLARLAGRSA